MKNLKSVFFIIVVSFFLAIPIANANNWVPSNGSYIDQYDDDGGGLFGHTFSGNFKVEFRGNTPYFYLPLSNAQSGKNIDWEPMCRYWHMDNSGKWTMAYQVWDQPNSFNFIRIIEKTATHLVVVPAYSSSKMFAEDSKSGIYRLRFWARDKNNHNHWLQQNEQDPYMFYGTEVETNEKIASYEVIIDVNGKRYAKVPKDYEHDRIIKR